MDFSKTFALNVKSSSDESSIVLQGEVRLTVLTSRMLRVETGAFLDKPSQKVWYRDFERPSFTVKNKGEKIFIETDKCTFCYDLKKRQMVYVELDGKKVTTFEKGNLKGTCRTLDGTVGPVKLGDGLVSTDGVALFDDSKSLVLESDGTICERDECSDVYFFAYAHDYRGCIQDFFKLTGKPPLVPRYCLGNWWSRYKAYSQNEYIELMEKFIEREIPITVATIDMDWHWVDVKEKFGKIPSSRSGIAAIRQSFMSSGWTGYSWNTDLFPDYKGLLSYLKSKNFKITVNLHPSDGVRWFEDCYNDMAKYMGIDPQSKETVEFDIANPRFIEAYFEFIHHPYEKDGVDFWWIDWQQGENTKLKGLDPLWALNHYHYLDSQKDNKRGLILSRYAQQGSHRYPLGFSGDTMVNWRCLNFQPYFTANATNVGYTWWSHDIGGHHFGKKDDELYLRWLQFGVFSPINRLHSTSNEFMGKEPWKFNCGIEHLATKYLKLRHRLIPYLYSMNWRTYHDGIGLIEPMYYEYPQEKEAYKASNQYLFGSELIVAPITKKMSDKTYLASVDTWLPVGRYTDIFNGYIYEGGKNYKMYRGLESFPVLAREGSIIPLDVNDSNNISTNPTKMELLIFRGDNTFTLYEDDGESRDFGKGAFAQRDFTVEEIGKNIRFTVQPYHGDLSVVNESVDYIFSFKDILCAEEIHLFVNGKALAISSDSKHFVKLCVNGIKRADDVLITLDDVTVMTCKPINEKLIELVSKFQCDVVFKKKVFNSFVNEPTSLPKVPKYYGGPLEEVMELK